MTDLLIRNARVVRPGTDAPITADIAVTDGTITAVAPGLDPADATDIIDANGQLAFPGLVDAHTHVGIYNPLEDDAVAESAAAATGGVTSMLTYFRTGGYYLDKTGPYADIAPEILKRSAGNYHVDYGYHLAPIHRHHIDEMESLIDDFGVSSFKIFMFYGSHGLHGRSSSQRSFLMLDDDETYDVAHFEFIMRELAAITQRRPELNDICSLSLHCELGEILSAYTRLVEADGTLTGLPAYSASRPPHSEGLAIFIASYLADETNCANINLLHLTSAKAIDAALKMRDLFGHINFRREVTIGHLLLDTDSPAGPLAKVNPPIRPRADVERLWEAVLAGDIDWVVSDHACCARDDKCGNDADDIFAAKSGFGGAEWLLSGLCTEGVRRGLSLGRIAELVSTNPATRYGLYAKGDLAPGYDADIVLVDPDTSFVVHAADSPSGQGYTPFEGIELTHKVTRTILRGHTVYDGANVTAARTGQYLRRPYGTATPSATDA